MWRCKYYEDRGVTHESILALAAAHPERTTLPGLGLPLRLHIADSERALILFELEGAAD